MPNKNIADHMIRIPIVRKIIVICICLIVCKLVWNIFAGPPHLEIIDMAESENSLGRFGDMQPRQCVFKAGSTECIPVASITKEQRVPGKGLYTRGSQFYLDGRPFTIFSGSFHYFRTHPVQWGDRLLRMKAAGLNTVMTYVPWNMHEKFPKRFSFENLGDIVTFVQQVKQVGMHLIVRPGPYICAEWEFGGLPGWLLHDPAMKVRSSAYRNYLTHIENYFSKLLLMLRPYTYAHGGPIIAFQVENEFGSYGHDKEYLEFVRKQFDANNISEMLFTSDGSELLEHGTVQGVLATVNFHKNIQEHLDRLKTFQPGKPLMVAEFWSGWFDHWLEPYHHDFPTDVFEKAVRTVLEANASINFYMFVGGTNFEFWNGANYKEGLYMPTITSYDYDAPISESGDLTPKYHVVRKLAQEFGLVRDELPQPPVDSEKGSYGVIDIKDIITFEDLVALVPEKIDTLPEIVPMEALNINNNGGQMFGWLLYRSSYEEGRVLILKGLVKDRAQVLVNGEEIAILDWNSTLKAKDIKLPSQNLQQSNVIDILVENLGRVNYVWKDSTDILSHQRKGFLEGKVFVDDIQLKKWDHVPFEFCDFFRQKVRASKAWKATGGKISQKKKQPAAYRAFLEIEGIPKDTFLDMGLWTKGIVLVNGFNIGRYWNVGPQRTLYIPAPLLVTGKNDIIVFELHRPHTDLVFVDKPLLGPVEEPKPTEF